MCKGFNFNPNKKYAKDLYFNQFSRKQREGPGSSMRLSITENLQAQKGCDNTEEIKHVN